MKTIQKGFVTPLLIIIAAVILIGGGVFYYVTNSNNEVSDKTSLNNIEVVIGNKLPEWKNYWQKIIPNFDISTFKKIREFSIATGKNYPEYPYDASQNKLRETIYIYSPDKTNAIDPKGGMELYEENGKILQAYDVDSSVKLIDLKNKTWKQILSCGTPCGFSGAAWIDNTTFVAVGMSEYYPENGEIRCTVDTKCTEVATVYVFDLLSNKSTLYYGPEVDKGIIGTATI